MIQSPFDITFTPEGGSAIVLVAEGGWIESRPSFDATQDMFEASGIKRANSHFQPMGNVVVEFTLVPETDHADLAAALNAFLADDDSIDLAGVLAIGDWQFADTVMTSESPDLPSGPTSTTVRTFQFKTSLPIPPDP